METEVFSGSFEEFDSDEFEEYEGEITPFSQEDDLPPFPGGALSRSAISDLKSSNSGIYEQDGEDQTPIIPPKRGRGRPRKNSVTFADRTELITPDPSTPNTPTKSPLLPPKLQKIGAKLLKDVIDPPKPKKSGIEFGDGGQEDPEFDEKKKLLMQIDMYHNFYPELKDSCPRKGKWSFKTNIRDLQEEIQRCKTKQATERAFSSMLMADKFFNYGIEWSCIQAGFPAHGLAAQAAASQDMVMDELRELSIKYVDWFDMGPEARYCFKLFNRVNFIIMQNQKIMEMQQAARRGTGSQPGGVDQSDIFQETVNKYDSL